MQIANLIKYIENDELESIADITYSHIVDEEIYELVINFYEWYIK